MGCQYSNTAVAIDFDAAPPGAATREATPKHPMATRCWLSCFNFLSQHSVHRNFCLS